MKKVVIYLLFGLLFQCKLKDHIFDDTLGLLENSEAPKILIHTPNPGQTDLGRDLVVYLLFNQNMNMESCTSAFQFEPKIEGKFEYNSSELRFFPDTKLPFGSYKIRVTKDCESISGKDLDTVYTIPFHVGKGKEVPELISVFAETGSLSQCEGESRVYENILNYSSMPILCRTQKKPIQFVFNTKMKGQLDQISFLPQISGKFRWDNEYTLNFSPTEPFKDNFSYTMLLLNTMVSSDSIPLGKNIPIAFVTNAFTVPSVLAVGVESQQCGLNQTILGGSSGANWNSLHCFWDSGKSTLPPQYYRFRGGDDGTGSQGSNFGCDDITTDNFKLIFSEFMDLGSVITSVRLSRISPPSTAIRLASWKWEHCQSEYPFGCRELTLLYSESEASCNGLLFGNSNTGGDFNLMKSNNAPDFFPFYELRVDTSAKSANGRNLPLPFVFIMEAK
ncbi:MAG: Ig-like protein [Leptospira sp.]|nr:Ig-like protein [Leptospira sp.]